MNSEFHDFTHHVVVTINSDHGVTLQILVTMNSEFHGCIFCQINAEGGKNKIIGGILGKNRRKYPQNGNFDLKSFKISQLLTNFSKNFPKLRK